MYIEDFPGCCTINILKGFGQTNTAECGRKFKTAFTIEQWLRAEIRDAREEGLAMLVATTNDQQKEGNKALRACGFRRTKWAKKDNHPETKVALWFKPLND